MDHKPSNPDTNSWVDDRMANLDPAPDWNPDASRALQQLTQRKRSVSAPWMRLAMTTTILAATVLVLVMLPWQRLWTPEAGTTPKVVAATVPQTGTAPQESPAPKPPAETAPQAPTVPAPQPADGAVLQDLPDSEKYLREDLAERAKTRAQNSPAGQVERALAERAKARGIAESSPTRLLESSPAQAAPTEITPPVVIHNVTPEYSQEAKQAKIQGTIELTITVKADGTVQFESFRKTLGYGLDEKAREAIEQWLFTPGKKNGVAVNTLTTVSMNFSLK